MIMTMTTPSQVADVSRLQQRNADVLSPLPGYTDIIQHHNETRPGIAVPSQPYRLPEQKRKVVQ